VADLGGGEAVSERGAWPEVLAAWRPELRGRSAAAAALAELYRAQLGGYERALSKGGARCRSRGGRARPPAAAAGASRCCRGLWCW
jgi:hypothetical protein